MNKPLKKTLRYIGIYGIFRTLTKVLGRLRPKFKLWLLLKFPFYSRSGKRIGLIGCGHHAFSSLAYFLTASSNSRIVFALDIDEKASSSLATAYGAVDVGAEYTPNKKDVTLPDLVYISSNHATHTDYAINFLQYGCDVFIEKPVSINTEQLDKLAQVVNQSGQAVYVGYNRPHSPAIKLVEKYTTHNKELPFTLSCFISGHFIPADHWYRDPSEGTRVVSNVGHWIDLASYMLFWAEEQPEFLDISVSYSDLNMPSDNIVVSMVSPRHDLITMTFTSRSEPFEGVNETINFQQGDVIAKIDDFRTTKIWKDDIYKKYRHWPKNNGHNSTVLQPFTSGKKRQWNEIEFSTRLMLHIEAMVLSQTKQNRFINTVKPINNS